MTWLRSCVALVLPAALVVCSGCGGQQEQGVPADLRAAIDAFYASVFRVRDREIVDKDASGALAHALNSYYCTYQTKHEELQWHKSKNVPIQKRGAGATGSCMSTYGTATCQ